MKRTISFTLIIGLMVSCLMNAKIVMANPGEGGTGGRGGSTNRSGDVGAGGGRSSTISGQQYLMIAPAELIRPVMSVADYVKLDEMAHMGDVGTGGGASRWLKRLRLKIARRLSGNYRMENLRELQGRTYVYTRSSIAHQEFADLTLAHIVRMRVNTFGSLEGAQVYAFYIKPEREIDSQKALKLGDIYAIELLDGSILLASDISEVVLELYFGER